LTFAAAEPFNADMAIIFAEAGKRDEAIAQVEANLKQFPESFLTVVKSGEAFEVLGDTAAAESYYRRAVAQAKDRTEESEATSQLIGLLEDLGRLEELDALTAPSLGRKPRVDEESPSDEGPLAPVGRNEPCSCGSGKKYKKCHGAG
jgi:uncharacterized protein YecA (UPF0149 family)